MVVSDGKDSPDNSNNNDNGGDNDDDGDNNSRAINSPNTAAATADNDNHDDEGVPRKTLVTSMTWRTMDAVDDDIPEGGVSNRPAMKLKQYSSLTFEALAPPRSCCS